MAPDIQEECSATPKSEEEVKPKEEVKPEEEVPRSFNVDNFFFRFAVFYCESRFRGVNDMMNLLKLEESFRAAWNTWLETPPEQRVEEAFKVFESCFKPLSNSFQTE